MPCEILKVLRGRSFRDTLFGKVRYGQARIRFGPQDERDIPVVIKEYNRQLVETRMTKNGERVGEDAKEELRIHSLLCSEHVPPSSSDASKIEAPTAANRYASDSKYIVQLYDVRKDDHYYYAILEFCSRGEFFPLVQHEQFTPAYARHYFKQLMLGFRYMHCRNIAHRDMSLENILLSRDGLLQICDFGVAIECESMREMISDAPGPPVGKVKFYMPPEVFERRPYSPFAVDVWTAGIILFVMLTKVHPFKYATQADQRFQMILRGEINELLARWSKPLLEPCVLSLLQRMLCMAEQRMTVDEILAHPYCNDEAYNAAQQQYAQQQGLAAVPVHPVIDAAMLDQFSQEQKLPQHQSAQHKQQQQQAQQAQAQQQAPHQPPPSQPQPVVATTHHLHANSAQAQQAAQQQSQLLQQQMLHQQQQQQMRIQQQQQQQQQLQAQQQAALQQQAIAQQQQQQQHNLSRQQQQQQPHAAAPQFQATPFGAPLHQQQMAQPGLAPHPALPSGAAAQQSRVAQLAAQFGHR